MIEDRYKNFKELDPPVPFDEYFKNRNYELVQVHMVDPETKFVIGFIGQFSWQNNKLTPLDGDCYNSGMKVLKYDYFIHEGRICLDILVGDDW